MSGVSTPPGALPIPVTIPNLPAATTPVSASDELVISQSGVAKNVTVGEFLSYLATSLPTTLPATAGILWNNGGVISVS